MHIKEGSMHNAVSVEEWQQVIRYTAREGVSLSEITVLLEM